MKIWNWLFGDDASVVIYPAGGLPEAACEVNPATGLPMLGGCDGVDAGGNPYGVNWSAHAGDIHTTPSFADGVFVDFGTQ